MNATLQPRSQDDAAALLEEARALIRAEKAAEAEAAARRCLVLDPKRIEAALILARALGRLDRFDEARAWFAVVLEACPDDGSTLIALGAMWRRMGRSEEALDCFSRVVAREPGRTQAHVGGGASLNDLGRLPEAEAAFRRAVALEPEHAEAHANLALVLLSLGRYCEGWAENEWRKRHASYGDMIFPGPRWAPQGPGHGPVLLYAEQGLGDTIQFLRYVPRVAAEGDPVTLQIQASLVSLVRAAGLGAESIRPRGVALPGYKRQCSLMDLMGVLGTTPTTIPWSGPYLVADAALVERWRHRRGGDPRPAVGLVWRGNPAHGNDLNRSVAPGFLAPLLVRPELRLISLQKHPRPGDLERLAEMGGVEHWGGELNDFDDTAAAMSALDLIVSVDSAPAHLAGALGKPAVVLLPRVADWRWGQAGEATAWYPAMTLLRQKTVGDWPAVVAALAARLASGALFSGA